MKLLQLIRMRRQKSNSVRPAIFSQGYGQDSIIDAALVFLCISYDRESVVMPDILLSIVKISTICSRKYAIFVGYILDFEYVF